MKMNNIKQNGFAVREFFFFKFKH